MKWKIAWTLAMERIMLCFNLDTSVHLLIDCTWLSLRCFLQIMSAKRREIWVNTNTFLSTIHFPYYTNEPCVLLKGKYISLIQEKETYEWDNGEK